MLPPLRAVIFGLDGAGPDQPGVRDQPGVSDQPGVRVQPGVSERAATGEHPGVRELAEDLVASGIRVGVVSGGSRAFATPLADRLLGRGTSDVLVTADDVPGIDPHPEVHLLAIYQLGVEPDEALAVESTLHGARSARTAGLATVLVADETRRASLVERADALVVFGRANGSWPHPLTLACCMSVHCAWWLRTRAAG